MGNAQSGDAGVAKDATDYVRTLHETSEDILEVTGLSDEATCGSICPRLELRPRVLGRRGGILPDAAVCDYAEKLVAARPRDGPRAVSCRQVRQQGVGDVSDAYLSTMAVDQHVGIYGDHRVPASP